MGYGIGRRRNRPCLAYTGCLPREALVAPAAYAVAGIHIGNGLLHLLASVIMRRRVPGVLSAPLLLVTGAWLAYAAATLD